MFFYNMNNIQLIFTSNVFLQKLSSFVVTLIKSRLVDSPPLYKDLKFNCIYFYVEFTYIHTNYSNGKPAELGSLRNNLFSLSFLSFWDYVVKLCFCFCFSLLKHLKVTNRCSFYRPQVLAENV